MLKKEIEYIDSLLDRLTTIKTKYDKKMAMFSDWIGINAQLENTIHNQGWKTWKGKEDPKHPAAREYKDFNKADYVDLANTVMGHICGKYCMKSGSCRFNFPKPA